MSSACPQEARISRLARSGPLDAAEREHLAACPSCREALRVAAALGALASPPEGAPLPTPGQIYLRAELRRRREQTDKARARAEQVARFGRTVGVATTVSTLA